MSKTPTGDGVALNSAAHPMPDPAAAAYDAFMRHAVGGHPSIVLVASTTSFIGHRDSYKMIWGDVAKAVIACVDPDIEAELSKVESALAKHVSVVGIEITMPERPDSMVKRVAERVYNNVGKQLTVDEEARRILEAMIEPTQEIIEAGLASLGADDDRSSAERVADAWRDQIKAAIGSRTWPTA